MKKRIAVITTVLALTALTAVPIVLAHPGRQGGRMSHGMGPGRQFGMLGHIERWKEELNLTEQQAARIQTIFAETREQNVQHREQLRNGRRAIAEALLAHPGDVAAAQALLDQQSAAERALKTNLLQATSKALAVLSDEQRAKAATLLGERNERRERRGRRGE